MNLNSQQYGMVMSSLTMYHQYAKDQGEDCGPLHAVEDAMERQLAKNLATNPAVEGSAKLPFTLDSAQLSVALKALNHTREQLTTGPLGAMAPPALKDRALKVLDSTRKELAGSLN